MKKVIFLISVFVIILIGFSVSTNYGFQFGFGTKGFIRKTLEKGQQEGKIPKTKEEKETKVAYSGKVDKFDLKEARYLFLAAKSTSTTSQSPIKFSPVLYQQSSTGEKVMFKLKSDGKIEEVHIYDETGQNYFDVNVNYVVNVGTGYISVGLDINGVWVVEITTQVVNGSTQTVVNKNYIPIPSVNKKYLVRLEDGAVYEGEVLPRPVNIEGKDISIVYEDQYGNFYFSENINNLERVVKLNTKDMSYKIVSMQDDRVITSKFIVDKYGNFAYLTQIGSGDGYRYRQTTATITGEIVHDRFWTTGVYSNSLITTDESKEAIYFIEQPTSSFGNVITKIECAPPSYEYKKSTMSFTFDGFQLSSKPEILDVEGKKVFIMQVLSTNNKTMFAYLDLETGTTNYYYEFDYKLGYRSYEVIGSSIVYSLYTPDQQNYKFYRIRPKEGSYEEIFSSNQYEIKSFYVDSNGYIIASGSRFSDGAKVMLKITPGNNTPEVLEALTSEVYYLIRVY